MALPVTNRIIPFDASETDISTDSSLMRLRRDNAKGEAYRVFGLSPRLPNPRPARREAPLGKKSEFCGQSPAYKESSEFTNGSFAVTAENPEKTPFEARKRRYKMQSAAANALCGICGKTGKDLGAAVARCLRRRKDVTRGIMAESNGKTARLGNVIICDKFWICPNCATRMSEADKRRLNAVMVAAMNKGWKPALLTYTLRHSQSDSLEALLGVNAAARRWFKSNSRFDGQGYQSLKKRYGIVGGVINLEATYGDENAWHPHSHEILFIDPEAAEYNMPVAGELPPEFWTDIRADLTSRWQVAVRRAGGDCDRRRGFSLKQGNQAVSDYIAKFGRDPVGTWSIESEITKAPVKLAKGKKGRSPFQLLADYEAGDRRAGELFAEYARCFDAKQHLHGLTKLEKLLGITGDSPVADETAGEEVTPAFEPVIELPADNKAWVLLCRAEKRAHFLEAALEGYAAVCDLLASVGYKGAPPLDLRAAAASHTSRLQNMTDESRRSSSASPPAQMNLPSISQRDQHV